MPRLASQIICTQEEIKLLNQHVSARKTEQQIAFRAKVILKYNDGLPNNKIAKELGTTALTVRKWRERFLKNRIWWKLFSILQMHIIKRLDHSFGKKGS